MEVTAADPPLAGRPGRTGRFRSRRWAWSVMTGGLLVLVGLFLVWQRPHTESVPPAGVEPPAAGSAPVLHVQVISPQRRALSRTLTLPGNISPMQQATIYAKVAGYLESIAVDKGDRVKKGQVLAVIDAPEVEEEYRQAEADHKIKQITAERLLNVWKANPDVVARQDVDVALAAAEGAKHVRDTRRQFLSYTKVTAPFSGTVTARFVDPGAFIQSGMRSATQSVPLLTLMDLDTVRVYVSVPQEAAARAKAGVPAMLTVKELPEQEFRGTVTRTTGALDPATRTLLVEIDLPNEQHHLQPGMFVTATLFLEEHSDALAIPPSALVPTPKGHAVYVVVDGHARLRPITTGIDDGLWIEVLNGLTGDEQVVVVGKAGLTDGQTVKAVPYNLPAGVPARQRL